MPRAASCGYLEWVPVGVAGEKMLLVLPSLWSLPHIEHLVYILLLDKGDQGIDTEESKYACHTIMDLHSDLPIAICVVLDKV